MGRRLGKQDYSPTKTSLRMRNGPLDSETLWRRGSQTPDPRSFKELMQGCAVVDVGKFQA